SVPSSILNAPVTMEPARGNRRTRVLWLLPAALVVSIGIWTLQRTNVMARGAVPAGWTVSGGAFRALNAAGQELWHSDLDTGLSDEVFSKPDLRREGEFVTIRDLDGDGIPEVMVANRSASRDPRVAFFIFNADGSTRARICPTERVIFGATEFAGPWLPG